MLKLTEFRVHLFAFFKVLTETDTYIDVAWKGKAYRVEVTDLDIKVPYRKKSKLPKSLKKDIRKMKCKQCGSLMINGVCMSPAKHL